MAQDTVRATLSSDDKPDELQTLVERMVREKRDPRVINEVVAQYRAAHPPEPEKPKGPPTVGEALSGMDPLTFVANGALGIGNLVKDVVVGMPQMAYQGVRGIDKVINSTFLPEDERRKVLEGMRDTLTQGAQAYGADLKKKWATSPGQTLQSFYDDPVSMVGDVATVATLGGTSGLKLAQTGGRIAEVAEAARLANAAKTAANVAGKVVKFGEAIDPAAIAMRTGARAVDRAGQVAIQATLPTRNALGVDFGASRRDMARRVQQSGVTDAKAAAEAAEAAATRVTSKADELDLIRASEDKPWGSMEPVIDTLNTGEARTRAESMRRQGTDPNAVKKLDERIAKLREEYMTSPGSPAVPPTVVEGASTADEAANLARVQSELGPLAGTVPSSTLGNVDPAMRARVEQLGAQANVVPPRFMANPQGVRLGGSPAQPPTFRPLPPSEMVRDIRTLQDAAFARGNKKPFKSLMDRTQAVELRQQRDKLFPQLTDLAKESEEAISVRRAFEEAEGTRPNWAQRGTNAALAASVGGPQAGVGMFLGQMALGSPKLGAKVGIGAHGAANFLANPRIMAMARAMRAAGQPQSAIDAAIMREMLAHPDAEQEQ